MALERVANQMLMCPGQLQKCQGCWYLESTLPYSEGYRSDEGRVRGVRKGMLGDASEAFYPELQPRNPESLGHACWPPCPP